jgi:hypothetical protein
LQARNILMRFWFEVVARIIPRTTKMRKEI